jgi:ADP-heptose:LPS heptosyltransferase
MKQLSATVIQKIAVFRALQLGDILCAIPALRALRTAYPSAKITFIGLPGSKPVIERFPSYFDYFLSFPGYPGLPEQAFNETEFEQFYAQMQEENFDLLLQMQGNGTIVNELLKPLAPKYFAGFSIEAEELQENPLLLAYPNFGHESTRHLSLMKHLGMDELYPDMEFPLYEKDYLDFDQLALPLTSEKYICMHPGSRGAWRQWPISHFATLGQIAIDHGFELVLTGVESERSLVEQLAALLQHRPIVAAGKTNLGSLGVLVKHATLLIANCTGISHIAAGLQTPSIIISMDGEPERWAPVNKALHDTIDWTTTPSLANVKTKLQAFMAQQVIPAAG